MEQRDKSALRILLYQLRKLTRSSYKVLSIKLSHAANDPLSDIVSPRIVRRIGNAQYVGETHDVSCLYQMGEGRACSRCTLRSFYTHYDLHVCARV